MKQTNVPSIWQHLPFHRGYPVPYIVHWANEPDDGQIPDFHLAVPKKWITCLKYKKCWGWDKSDVQIQEWQQAFKTEEANHELLQALANQCEEFSIKLWSCKPSAKRVSLNCCTFSSKVGPVGKEPAKKRGQLR